MKNISFIENLQEFALQSDEDIIGGRCGGGGRRRSGGRNRSRCGSSRRRSSCRPVRCQPVTCKPVVVTCGVAPQPLPAPVPAPPKIDPLDDDATTNYKFPAKDQ